MRPITKLWIAIAILAILSPIGLMLPEIFKAGSAWGEWGIDEIKELAGYIPDGISRLSNIKTALMPDYSLRGWEGKGLLHQSIAYIISGFLGAALVAVIILLIGKKLSSKK
jgi:cobalt/nickel transport protein